MEQIDLFAEKQEKTLSPRNRIVLVDLNSIARSAYAIQYGTDLGSYYTLPSGESGYIKTTMISIVVKFITNLTSNGTQPVYCFGDSPIWSRKVYMGSLYNEKVGGKSAESTEYKGNRGGADSEFFKGMRIIENILVASGVPVIRQENYEADDLIYAFGMCMYRQYPNYYIDIITGDSDMIPMVNDRISVYYKSKKLTFSEEGHPKRRGYYQITPNSYEDICQDMSKTKGHIIPYNTLLLHKIIRGDSDNVNILSKDWKPKLYNEFINDYGYNWGFQLPYSDYTSKIVEIDSGNEVEDLANYQGNKGNLKKVYELEDNSIDIVVACAKALEYKYNDEIDAHNQSIDEAEAKSGRVLKSKKRKERLNLRTDLIKERYLGMNLNGAFSSEMVGGDSSKARKPFLVRKVNLVYADISRIKALSLELGIHVR